MEDIHYGIKFKRITRLHKKNKQKKKRHVPEGFEPDSFPLKYQQPTFKYKIHSVEVDLYYLK